MVAGRMVGSPVRRREDPRLLCGKGRYVADIQLARTAHLELVRSSRPHARLRSVDVSAAKQADGVLLVLVGTDLVDVVTPFPCIDLAPNGKPALHRVLAIDKVRYVGEPIAAVVAETPAAAKAAVDLVVVDYEDLPVVLDLEAAADDETAPILHEEFGTNRVNVFEHDVGDVDVGFATAPHHLEAEFRVHRVSAAAMETRGVLAEVDSSGARVTLYSSTQFPHFVRTFLSAVLGIPQPDIRVVAPDVGGGFGSKLTLYPEEVLAVVACRQLNRPVRWIETRQEHFLTTTHGREQYIKLRAAYDDDGVISALELYSLTGVGGYMTTLAGSEASISSAMVRGPYRIPNYRAKAFSVLTNKPPLSVYRGAGQPQAVLSMEAIVDRVAAALGLDRIEVRLRNMLTPKELPSDRKVEIVMAGKVVYDSGDYPEALKRAADIFEYTERQAAKEEARREGRIVGVGIACFVEETAIGPYETGNVSVDPSGRVTVLTGISAIGQGIATAITQLVADELLVPMESIVIKSGDTDVVTDGMGTYASRGGAIGGAAARLAARKVKQKALIIAADMFGVPVEDLEWTDQGARINATQAPPALSLGAIAQRATAWAPLTPGLSAFNLEEKHHHQVPGIAFANGAHMAEVEIDRETGVMEVTHYTSFHDCGTVINPMIIQGQVHGGVAQGLGGTLFEENRYDEKGYPISNGFLNYLIPTAGDMPKIKTGHMESPTYLNPFGMKGAGEGGTVGAIGCITNAVADALRPLGIELDIDGPFTPPNLLKMIKRAEERQI